MIVRSTNWLKFRIFVILVGFILITITISARAYQLHVLKSEEYSQHAKRQRESCIPIAPKRGVIYDRNKEELAVSVDVDSIYADPRKVTDISKYVKKLSPILKVNGKKLRERLSRKRHFTWIKRRVPPDQSLKVRGLKLDGIDFLKEAKRFHPNRELAGCIVGFVGLDPKGLEGLELEYDNYLKGEGTFSIVERDALGRTIFSHGLERRDALTGNDLVLTIDKTIQYIAETELSKAVLKAKAESGIVIVMNPKTGELLAIAVNPQFNPNIFWKYPAFSWRNRAITDSFEPGSTFKVFSVAAAIEEGILSRNNIFFCENGSYKVGRETISDVHPHGWLSVKNIIKYSSNIGAGKLGEKLGKDKLYEYIKKFGFGEKTGIDLPGETKCLVRPLGKWSRVALDTISFGQGISVSAIQLVTGLSAIANKGQLMKPHVVRQIISPKGKVIREFKAQAIRKVLSEKTAGEVTYILKSTVLKGGTGVKASFDGYEVAGKTGTAQKVDSSSGTYFKNKYIASFMGFVPADHPEIAILVVIDEPKGSYYGGDVAAPVFKRVSEKTLRYLGVLPSKVFARDSAVRSGSHIRPKRSKKLQARADGVTIKSGRFVMPDLSGMSIRRALKLMHGSGIDVRIVGSGRAVEQSIKPGRAVKAGGKCWINFQQPS